MNPKRTAIGRKAIWGIFLLAFFALAPGCSSKQAESPTPTPLPTSPALVSTTYLVQRGDVVGQVHFGGDISPVVEKTVFFPIDGRIHQVYFNKGDAVKAGQVIADLEGEADLESQLELKKLDDQRAQLNIQIAQDNLDLFKATTSVTIPGYEILLRIKESYLELAKIDEAETALGISGLEDAIANTKLIAPLDGIILSLGAIEGLQIKGYQPMAIVADISQLEVSADVLSVTLSLLTVGMRATIVSVLGNQNAMTGKIRLLPGSSSGVSENDTSTHISLNQNAAENGYMLGESVTVNIVLELRKNTLWVPPQVIRTYEGRQFVIVQDGTVQRRVDVKIGVVSDDRVEILEGLSEGQVVVGP